MVIAALALAAVFDTLPRHATFGAALGDKKGVTVTRVIAGGAAEHAGIAAGDVIVKIDASATPNVASFLAVLHHYHAGQHAALAVNRNGLTRTIGVTFGAPADEADPAVTTSYGSVSVDGSLRRTLTTYPNDAKGPLPAVLILGGIGCYSVDVAANPQDSYMHLAHDVSRAGFVTMRVEKSGVGDSQGPSCASVDFAAEERMYAAALSALRGDPKVDAGKVYLLGHSIGTVEAARLAAKQPVAGVIAAEAVGRDWPEYEIRNLRRQLELSGEPPSQVDRELTEKQECMQRLLFEMQPEKQIERAMPFCKDPNGVYPASAAYMQQVARINIIDDWSKINVPVLAIYGSSDAVTEEADHQRIVDTVNARHLGLASLHVVNEMDHLLFTAPSMKAALDAFSSGAARTYDTAFSATVVQWLQQMSHS